MKRKTLLIILSAAVAIALIAAIGYASKDPRCKKGLNKGPSIPQMNSDPNAVTAHVIEGCFKKPA